MSALRKFSHILTWLAFLSNDTTGWTPTGETSESYQEWKREFIAKFPNAVEDFAVIERPSSWSAIFEAMNNLNYTQDDVHEIVASLETEGENLLSNEIANAARSTSSFNLMRV